MTVSMSLAGEMTSSTCTPAVSRSSVSTESAIGPSIATYSSSSASAIGSARYFRTIASGRSANASG